MNRWELQPQLLFLISILIFQGRRCVLKDCCMIEDGAILPAETVVSSFTRYGGSPARVVADLPEATQDLMIDFTKNYYQHFVPGKPWNDIPY